MFLIRKNKLTGDYSIEASEHGFHLNTNDFNHGINEFWIVATKEESEKITDKLEKEYNAKGE